MFVESQAKILVFPPDKTFIVTYTGRDVSVYPVLPLLILVAYKPSQDGHEGGEVEKCGSGREPKLLK